MNSVKNWEVLSTFTVYSSQFTVEKIMQILLENRDVKTKKEREDFLHPKLEDVTIESLKIDKMQLAKACKRIEKAIQNNEKIVIYGDYDVDGITGTAVLWESLYAIGASVIPYIPHRIEEGYGLSVKGIINVLAEYPDTKLIITVDNGIVANEAVDFANKKGIDVIITDHHTIGESLPKAYAIVHTTSVCGAAVGWLFSQEITNSKSQDTNKYKISGDHLSLVALATVADLVPLTRANRTLLKFGLEVLKNTKRPGLLALFTSAKIEPDKIDVYTIGHGIAPRLNAMGRLESAMDSLRLLCTKDKNRGNELAQKLELTNKQRQLLTTSTVEHAKMQVISQKSKIKSKILFIHHDSYEEGVIGLVAGKLVESFYLPAIVLSRGEKYSKASARSIAGFNIIEAIRKTSNLLVNAGGHPMAAGFTVETEKLELVRDALEQIADGAISETMLQRILRIDMEIPLEIINQKLFDEIQKLSPFGMAVPEPVFASEVIVKEIRQIGMDGKHLKMKVNPFSPSVIPAKAGIQERNGSRISSVNSLQDKSGITQEFDAIAFGMGEYAVELKKEDKITIAYTVDENTWNNKTTLQLKVKDIKPLSR